MERLPQEKRGSNSVLWRLIALLVYASIGSWYIFRFYELLQHVESSFPLTTHSFHTIIGSPGLNKSRSYARFYRDELCEAIGIRKSGDCCKSVQAPLAAEVNRLFTPWIEGLLPKGIPDSTVPIDDSHDVNCQSEKYHEVLTGDLRDTPRIIVDVFPFAHELLLAEGRLWELDGLADFVIVAESNSSMRGIPKERHFYNTNQHSENWDRWYKQLFLVNIDDCPMYVSAVEKYRVMGKHRPQTIWPVQNAHRSCIWSAVETSLGMHIPDDALIIFSDADEIPGRHAIRHLKHCDIRKSAWPILMQAQSVAAGTLRTLSRPNCLDSSSSWKSSSSVNTVRYPIYLASHIRRTGEMQRHILLSGMYPEKTPRTYITSGIHITYAGGLPALDYKGINHAEGGQIPPWIDASGGGENLCNFTDDDYCRRLEVYQNQPSRAIRTWEKQEPKPPLPSLSDDDTAKHCGVPWVFIQNRKRYRVLWGEDTCEELKNAMFFLDQQKEN